MHTSCNMSPNLDFIGELRNMFMYATSSYFMLLKKNMLLSDAALSAQRFISAWTFCHIWTTADNTCLVFCTIQKLYEYKRMEKAELI